MRDTENGDAKHVRVCYPKSEFPGQICFGWRRAEVWEVDLCVLSATDTSRQHPRSADRLGRVYGDVK